MTASATTPVVAIIGGGFSGAATAYHLATQAKQPLSLLLFEPRAVLGAGVAYSTLDPTHRINVPAVRMSLLPENEGHFAHWLEQHHGAEDGKSPADDPHAVLPDGRCFAARRLFGDYVAAQMQPLIDQSAVRHHRARVAAIQKTQDGWRIESDDGQQWPADMLVIATSHPPPVPPAILRDRLKHSAKFITDPWAKDALSAVRATDRILIVGTGLTMADVMASLDQRGHSGPITAISRRGQRSRSHAPTAVEPAGDFLSPPAISALDLLRNVRRAAGDGSAWHGLFDQLRLQGGDIWHALSLKERRRLIRHLRPFWDTHRFRIAPQVGDVIDRKLADGSLTLWAASVKDAVAADGQFTLSLQSRSGKTFTDPYDVVIATTGPGHGSIIESQPFLAQLAAAGLLADDPTGLGLAVDENSRLLGPNGPNATIYVAGPLARGTFGELMGLPEVTHHAKFVADQLLAHLGADQAAQRHA